MHVFWFGLWVKRRSTSIYLSINCCFLYMISMAATLCSSIITLFFFCTLYSAFARSFSHCCFSEYLIFIFKPLFACLFIFRSFMLALIFCCSQGCLIISPRLSHLATVQRSLCFYFIFILLFLSLSTFHFFFCFALPSERCITCLVTFDQGALSLV